MIVRQATREDIAAFSDMANKPTILAWVGEDEGKVVGIAGFAYSRGRWFGFCDLRPEARKYKMTIARAAIRAMREARARGIRYVYAQPDPEELGAKRWLTSLGFSADHRTPSLYRWGK